MPPKNSPSIYPYLAASFIESSKHGGTIEAIRFITQEELKNLRDAHKKAQELKKVMAEAEKKEAHIFSRLQKLDQEGGVLIYSLSGETKRFMHPLFFDLLYLYEHRMGKDEAIKLRKLLFSHDDEPFDFVLEYEMDHSKKRFYIKRMSLIGPPKEDNKPGEGSEEGTSRSLYTA